MVMSLGELKFRCPKCGENDIVYRTDPALRSYVVHSGGRVASGGGMEYEDMVKANDAAGGADADDADAEDEMTAKIEKHQKAAMDAEVVDDEVADELRNMLFPADALMRAVRARHEAAQQEAQQLKDAAAAGTALSDEERAARDLDEEVPAWRPRLGSPGAPGGRTAAR